MIYIVSVVSLSLCRLTPLPTLKNWMCLGICIIFLFPSVKGICLGHLQARAPFIVFFSISFIAYEVLYTVAPLMGIHYFVDVPFLCSVLSDYGLWSGQFMVREEERVIWDIPFQQVCMKTREGVWVVQ